MGKEKWQNMNKNTKMGIDKTRKPCYNLCVLSEKGERHFASRPSKQAKEDVRVKEREIWDVACPQADENVHVGICPYYKKELGHGKLRCEGANLSFPDILARREFVYSFCAHPTGYKDCQLKAVLDHYYERKYKRHEA
jgi:hypothetical protein